MVIIGVNPHKRSDTARTVDPAAHRAIATLQIDAGPTDCGQLSKWASSFEDRREQVQDTHRRHNPNQSARAGQPLRGRRHGPFRRGQRRSTVGRGNLVITENLAAVMVISNERRNTVIQNPQHGLAA